MAGRAWIIIPLVMAGTLAWEITVAATLTQIVPNWPELALYAVDKIGFALVIAIGLTFAGVWRKSGFAGGLAGRRFGLLWPIWLAAASALIQGVAVTDPVQLLAWLAVATAIAFGEEAVFRGIITTALGLNRPRSTALISAGLFGLIHLVGLASPIDARIIALQAVTAGGLGLVLAGTRLLTGSIWPGLIAHAALDFFGVAAADGITDAMPNTPEEYAFLAVMAVIAIAWGLVLVRRLPSATGEWIA
jgi:membrane protease YdiL (CAAX protease family)